MKKARYQTEDDILYGPIYMKSQEWANLEKQKVDWWLLGAGEERNGEQLLMGIRFILIKCSKIR